VRNPADARLRLVALTDRGRAAVEGAREHRAALVEELGERLGPRRVEAANRLLHDVVAGLGADAAVHGRRVRAPR
jgi:DNA-binding MarR family transcriptional regulator